MNTEIPVKGRKRPGGKKRDALSLIAVAVMLIAVLYVFSCRSIGRLPYIFGHTFVRITTGSMEPEIPTDSFIIVRSLTDGEARSLAPDQIIIFESKAEEIKGMLNTHRIVSVNPDGSYVTKGDYNIRPDNEAIYPEEVLGLYVDNAEGLTRVYRAVKDNIVAVAVLGILLTVAYIAICTAWDMMEKKHRSPDEIAKGELERISKDEELQRLIRAKISEEVARLRAEGLPKEEIKENNQEQKGKEQNK